MVGVYLRLDESRLALKRRGTLVRGVESKDQGRGDVLLVILGNVETVLATLATAVELIVDNDFVGTWRHLAAARGTSLHNGIGGVSIRKQSGSRREDQRELHFGYVR